MKILSIRGENLASLHGPFEIDFEAAPLDRAGLFAITGPTGAGKSTLLDAICLALYGTTPRMQSVSGRGHTVGSDGDENPLTSTDPAGHLRKGTAAGSAEVIFRGRDGNRYRASWSVRRARNRIDGRVQAPSVQLWNEETGDAIGRTSREVYRAIEERVGLSYDQFCRSVLLAQGEFARFLLAHEKERAELLERVTGTEIYRRISIAAHERHSTSRLALNEVERELDGVRILSSEERARLEAEQARLGEVLVAARAQLQQAKDAVAWHDALAALVRSEGEAEQAAASALREWVEAAPLREALAGVELVSPLRQTIDAAAKAAAGEERAASNLEEALRVEGEASKAREEAGREATTSKLLLDAATRRQVEAAPLLEEARRLDTLIEAAKREAQRARTAFDEAAGKASSQRNALEGLRGSIASEEEALAAATAWLGGNAGLEPLAAQWDRWRDQLLRIAGARKVETEAMEHASAAAEAARVLEGQLLAATSAASHAGAALAGAGREAEEASARAARIPRAALRERRGALDLAEQKAREMEGLSGTARRLQGEVLAFREEATHAAQEARQAHEARHGFEAQRELLARQLEEAGAARREAHQALDLTEQRALLREGEACPLCGSEEHPWASETIAIAERVREREEREASLRGQFTEVEGLRAEADARAKSSEQRHETAEKNAIERAGKIPELEAKWEKLHPSLLRDIESLRVFLFAAETGLSVGAGSLPGEAVAQEAGRLLEELLQRIGFARRELAKEEAESDSLEEVASRARASASSLREKKEERENASRTLGSKLQEVASQERELRAKAENARREGASLSRPLLPLLEAAGKKEVSLEQDPLHVIAVLEEEIAGWRKHDDARGRAAERLKILGPRLDAALSVLGEHEALGDAAAKASSDAATILEGLLGQRAQVLGGGRASDHESALREAGTQASLVLEKARDGELSAAAALTRAVTLRESHEIALDQAKKEHLARRLEREQALEAVGLSLEEVMARLSHPREEIERWRQAHLDLEKRKETSRTRLEERQRVRASHVEEGRPPLDEAAARLAAEERKEPRDQAEVAFHDVRNALRRDDEARERGKAILPRLEAHKAEAKKWADLHELIGSASGDKFQLFAQSITLEVLLAHANVHLEELAPRYRLERVPGHDLQLQVVDRNMGDEIRAANSLSGGETFLVSLALALGLSGLSSRTKVESLFVDEGFGSLDPHTLDIALASLDALQATGRKVGVISHVQGMAERIGVQIQVQPQGNGRSRVSVVAG